MQGHRCKLVDLLRASDIVDVWSTVAVLQVQTRMFRAVIVTLRRWHLSDYLSMKRQSSGE